MKKNPKKRLTKSNSSDRIVKLSQDGELGRAMSKKTFLKKVKKVLDKSENK